MVLIGSDFHPSWQQVCWLNLETGETEERKLVHAPGETEKFYRQFPVPSRIGLESTGNCQWFVDLLTRLGHEVLIGDAAKIRASDVRQQKHDKRDAQLLLRLLREDHFPEIWTPSSEVKDQRQLLVEAAQTAVRCDPSLRNEYLHRCHKKAKAVAKVVAARKLAIRLYWMLRTKKRYSEIVSIESSSRVPLAGAS